MLAKAGVLASMIVLGCTKPNVGRVCRHLGANVHHLPLAVFPFGK
jgi:hypothetical protein